MFLDTHNVADTAGLSATAILLMILNIAFLALVAFVIVKQGARHIVAFAKQIHIISKGVFRLVKAPFTRRKKQPTVAAAPASHASLDAARPARAYRSGSMQPMLLDVPTSSSLSGLSVESPGQLTARQTRPEL